MYLLIAFILVPLIEIALFIQVGGAIGLWPTLAIVILTAIAGTWLVRQQGLQAIQNLQKSFSELQDPTRPLADGAMILISGALLLTPGFFTDAVGFALLMPPVRKVIYEYLRKRVKVHRFEMGQGPQHPRRHPDDDVIDGDYSDVTPEDRKDLPPSGWTRH
ncbi:FxsA family protein [Primorskyibacter aestuariivivens]|uniref:FxsA family protein n=1 Tax=Primorskyibacter aestuariivivens TaxID=1888912 RepID=UPI002301B6AE|nr:FxsA family protein [Primorskyibacter aestuariivivens]MDA7427676.1 FxsA family protein [Primorskyibacter aestuariivivens]